MAYYQYADHPRLCGEKRVYFYDNGGLPGSPPPMRGKVLTVCLAQFFFRITPAYAGKRLWSTALCRQTGDHPRLCGEKLDKCSD